MRKKQIIFGSTILLFLSITLFGITDVSGFGGTVNVTGYIRDLQGNPLSGASVQLWDPVRNRPVSSVFTSSSNGRYPSSGYLSAPCFGSYLELRVWKSGYDDADMPIYPGTHTNVNFYLVSYPYVDYSGIHLKYGQTGSYEQMYYKSRVKTEIGYWWEVQASIGVELIGVLNLGAGGYEITLAVATRYHDMNPEPELSLRQVPQALRLYIGKSHDNLQGITWDTSYPTDFGGLNYELHQPGAPTPEAQFIIKGATLALDLIPGVDIPVDEIYGAFELMQYWEQIVNNNVINSVYGSTATAHFFYDEAPVPLINGYHEAGTANLVRLRYKGGTACSFTIWADAYYYNGYYFNDNIVSTSSLPIHIQIHT